MSRRFELLVFDWDGTLMDSAGTIVACIQAACRDLALPVPGEAAARHIIGLGLNEALGRLLPGLPVSEHGRVVERYRHHYLGQDESIPLFAGAAEAVRGLNDAGFLLAVATGKSRVGLERALRNTALKASFHASRCADECASKPQPAMLLELMAELGVPPERTLMIGDTTHDLEMAANAGVAGLGCAYGAHPRAELAALAPLGLADSFPELCSWLAQNA